MEGEADSQVLFGQFLMDNLLPGAAGPDAEPFNFDLERVLDDIEDLGAAVAARNGDAGRLPRDRVKGVVQCDLPLSADDLERVHAGSFEAAVQGADDAVVVQDRGDA